MKNMSRELVNNHKDLLKSAMKSWIGQKKISLLPLEEPRMPLLKQLRTARPYKE